MITYSQPPTMFNVNVTATRCNTSTLDICVSRNSHQPSQPSEQEANKSRCHTWRIEEDRIPTRIDKPSGDTTRIRRHR